MGEANSEAIALIRELIGHEPRYGETPDGQQCLHIGDTVIVATEFALWSDPSVWVNSETMFTLSWGGHNARFYKDGRGQWAADVNRDLLRGQARWVP